MSEAIAERLTAAYIRFLESDTQAEFVGILIDAERLSSRILAFVKDPAHRRAMLKEYPDEHGRSLLRDMAGATWAVDQLAIMMDGSVAPCDRYRKHRGWKVKRRRKGPAKG